MSDTPVSDLFSTLSLEPVSTVDRVAEELRRSLFEGELGPGTPLREVALAAALGVSRSTVREALGVLVAEGLADRVPNKGTQVRRLDPEQVRDVCQARVVIETAGIRRWNEADDTLRNDVRRALQAFSDLTDTDYTPAEFTAAHLEIHRALSALTGSSRWRSRCTPRCASRWPTSIGPAATPSNRSIPTPISSPCWRRATSTPLRTSSPHIWAAPKSPCSKPSASAVSPLR